MSSKTGPKFPTEVGAGLGTWTRTESRCASISAVLLFRILPFDAGAATIHSEHDKAKDKGGEANEGVSCLLMDASYVSVRNSAWLPPIGPSSGVLLGRIDEQLMKRAGRW